MKPRENPLKVVQVYSSHELDVFVRTLIELAQIERLYDTAKVHLMQKVDFNLTDAFKIFDNKLDKVGVKEGLDAIGVYPTLKECD